MAFARATGHRCRDTRGRSTRTIRIGGRRRSSGDGSATTCSGRWWREGFGHRGVRVVHVRSDQGPLDFEYSIELPALRGDVGGGLGVVLTYLRGFRGLGRTLKFTGPPAHPVALLVEEQRVRPRGRSNGGGCSTLSGPSRDAGTRRCRARWCSRSRTRCSPRTEGPSGWSRRWGWCRCRRRGLVPIGCGRSRSERCRLYSGFCRRRAVGLGCGRGGSAWVGSAFAGPAPWMHDFF